MREAVRWFPRFLAQKCGATSKTVQQASRLLFLPVNNLAIQSSYGQSMCQLFQARGGSTVFTLLTVPRQGRAGAQPVVRQALLFDAIWSCGKHALSSITPSCEGMHHAFVIAHRRR